MCVCACVCVICTHTHTNETREMPEDAVAYVLYDLHQTVSTMEKEETKYLGINLIRNSENLRRKTTKVHRTS